VADVIEDSTDGGRQMRYSAAGSEIFYVDDEILLEARL
jgi:hypothetical protein